jgi:Fe-S-cluster containining protein
MAPARESTAKRRLKVRREYLSARDAARRIAFVRNLVSLVRMTAIDPSALCLECGLCCQGVVFSGVRLHEDEVEWAKKKRLDVLTYPGGHAFRSPCTLLREETKCGAYEERPRRCRAFECKTLVSYTSGAIDLGTALASLDEIISLKEDIEDCLPKEQNVGYFWNFMALHADPRVPEEERAKIEDAFDDVIEPAKMLRALIVERIHPTGTES